MFCRKMCGFPKLAVKIWQICIANCANVHDLNIAKDSKLYESNICETCSLNIANRVHSNNQIFQIKAKMAHAFTLKLRICMYARKYDYVYTYTVQEFSFRQCLHKLALKSSAFKKWNRNFMIITTLYPKVELVPVSYFLDLVHKRKLGSIL